MICNAYVATFGARAAGSFKSPSRTILAATAARTCPGSHRFADMV
jgi:hypothetical protein